MATLEWVVRPLNVSGPVTTHMTLAGVRMYIQTLARQAGATRVVERELQEGRYHFVVRVGEIGTLASLIASPAYEAHQEPVERGPVRIGVPVGTIDAKT